MKKTARLVRAEPARKLHYLGMMLSHALLVFSFALFSPTVYAVNSCPSLFSAKAPRSDGNRALRQLVSRYSATGEGLLSQRNFTIAFPENACGSVCATNIIQTIRTMKGLEPEKDPAKIANQLHEALPETRAGTSAANLARTIAHINAKFLSFAKVRFAVQATRFGAVTPAPHLKIADEIDSRLIMASEKALNILGYVSLGRDGKTHLGAHYVLVSRRAGNSIYVVDPSSPSHEMEMTLASTPRNGGPYSALRLTPKDLAYFKRAYGPEFESLEVFATALIVVL